MSLTSTSTSHTRPIALLAIAATVVAAGGVVGATTSAINGAVSPEYYRSVMEWGDIEHIWRASVAQGIFVGLIYGIVFSIVLTLVVGIVSRAQCSYAYGLRRLFGIPLGVYAGWALGGIIGVGLAALSPDFFERTFLGVPEAHGEMLRYAWVGGSTMGAMNCAILALVVGSILFAVRWRRSQHEEAST